MSYDVALPNGFVITDDRARLDLDEVHRWLSSTYWARDRTAALNRRTWSNCLPFGIFGPDGTLAGFARLLTDYTLRAHLGDVFILPERRGLGLGKALMVAILAHPELATVDHWTLTTSDAHSLYARHGFRVTETDGKWMALDRSPR